jgi:hypothetical protein
MNPGLDIDGIAHTGGRAHGSLLKRIGLPTTGVHQFGAGSTSIPEPVCVVRVGSDRVFVQESCERNAGIA